MSCALQERTVDHEADSQPLLRPQIGASPGRATILVVDDNELSRKVIGFHLQAAGHRVVEAATGSEALNLALHDRPHLVISDLLMPEIDGFELCRRFHAEPLVRDVPFVFITSTYVEPQDMRLAEDIGARRVLLKPVDAEALCTLVATLLSQGDGTPSLLHDAMNEKEFQVRHAQTLNAKLKRKVDELEFTNTVLRRSETNAQHLLRAVVGTITKMVEYRDPCTIGHEHRVGELAVEIGRGLGFDESRMAGLRFGGCLHDVGKIAVPTQILTKPGRLTAVETALMRCHAQAGYEILRTLDFPWRVAEMALQHHERLDGTGYPQGLVGDEILLEARILAVADVVAAMVSHRPYRPAVGLDKAMDEIHSGSGRLYDASVVHACHAAFESGFRFSGLLPDGSSVPTPTSEVATAGA